ncbi:tetratricopeptide repeat protein, partial [Acinetobacter baumannii]
DRARSLNNLAIRLSETGDRLGALRAAQRAAELYQDLARDNPAAFTPDLAISLYNLAISLSETGDRQGALRAAQRAVELREDRARDNPAAVTP